MLTALIILICLVAILLVLVVLGQNSKGGSFASNFSASNQLIGVKKTGDLLENLTWGLAATLIVLCIITNIVISSPDEGPAGTPATRSIGNGQQVQPIAPATEEEAPAGNTEGAAPGQDPLAPAGNDENTAPAQDPLAPAEGN